MLLCTSGFPYAGKTTFVNALTEQIGQFTLHINPKDYYPDDVYSLPQEQKTIVFTTAWEMSLEKALKSINILPNKALIVFDTCCSNAMHVRQLFIEARLKSHTIFSVYIDTPSNIRFMRANDEQVKTLEDKYKTNFSRTLPSLKNLSDYFYIIKGETVDPKTGIIAEQIKAIMDG